MRATQMLKLCVMPLDEPDGQPAANLTWPSDVGAANYHFEDGATAMRASLSMSNAPFMDMALFDFTCAPGWMAGKGENGCNHNNPSTWHNCQNVSHIVEHSPGWSGAHAIQPVPASFFRTEYTPSAHEEEWAAYPRNQVVQNADGVGGHGGTCTCPNGEVYRVGDWSNNCGSLACIGGVQGDTCGSDNDGGRNVMVICATTNVRESGVDGLGNWGGTCTCPDGQVFNVGSIQANGGCNAWNNGVADTAACYGGVIGATCSSTNPGGRRVRVTCAVESPPSMPPRPPPMPMAPPPPPPATMWAAVLPNGAAAFTDADIDGTPHATAGGGLVDANVFWGFQGAQADAIPDFGASCSATASNGTLLGTPCAPGVLPTYRYNLLLVRAGAHAFAGRRGLSQRRWTFSAMAEVSDFYDDAGLLPQPGHFSDAPAPPGTVSAQSLDWPSIPCFPTLLRPCTPSCPALCFAMLPLLTNRPTHLSTCSPIRCSLAFAGRQPHTLPGARPEQVRVRAARRHLPAPLRPTSQQSVPSAQLFIRRGLHGTRARVELPRRVRCPEA